ncbi:hypothetical protein KIL84_023232 [Mauremys mutica]|uniref:Uncharacterized protein n=1 Tax=Mauremys mutica TaxID=74926 RepID=A0A9D4APE9_9SAUR|nr:hypothetical protein KIL84_023232 [Mauremys mutica]
MGLGQEPKTDPVSTFVLVALDSAWLVHTTGWGLQGKLCFVSAGIFISLATSKECIHATSTGDGYRSLGLLGGSMDAAAHSCMPGAGWGFQPSVEAERLDAVWKWVTGAVSLWDRFLYIAQSVYRPPREGDSPSGLPSAGPQDTHSRDFIMKHANETRLPWTGWHGPSGG